MGKVTKIVTEVKRNKDNILPSCTGKISLNDIENMSKDQLRHNLYNEHNSKNIHIKRAEAYKCDYLDTVELYNKLVDKYNSLRKKYKKLKLKTESVSNKETEEKRLESVEERYIKFLMKSDDPVIKNHTKTHHEKRSLKNDSKCECNCCKISLDTGVKGPDMSKRQIDDYNFRNPCIKAATNNN